MMSLHFLKKSDFEKQMNNIVYNKYLLYDNQKIYLDLKSANADMLINNGIPISQIEVSELCTYEEKDLLHSYRRDGKYSGRAIGLIAMRKTNVL